ncbi:MAG: DUF4337 family protein [Acetobacteraceae bacterium]
MSDAADIAREHLEHAARHAESGPHGADEAEVRRTHLLAMLVAVLAAALALAEIEVRATQTEAIHRSVMVSDSWNWYQARSMKGAVVDGALAVIAALPPTPATAKEAAALRSRAAAIESDPKKGAGKQQLLALAQRQEKERDHATHRMHLFELSAAGLQIALVLASASAITRRNSLAFAAMALGGIAAAWALALTLLAA